VDEQLKEWDADRSGLLDYREFVRMLTAGDTTTAAKNRRLKNRSTK